MSNGTSLVRYYSFSDELEKIALSAPAIGGIGGALLGAGIGASTAEKGHRLRNGLIGGAIGGATGALGGAALDHFSAPSSSGGGSHASGIRAETQSLIDKMHADTESYRKGLDEVSKATTSDEKIRILKNLEKMLEGAEGTRRNVIQGALDSLRSGK